MKPFGTKWLSFKSHEQWTRKSHGRTRKFGKFRNSRRRLAEGKTGQWQCQTVCDSFVESPCFLFRLSAFRGPPWLAPIRWIYSGRWPRRCHNNDWIELTFSRQFLLESQRSTMKYCSYLFIMKDVCKYMSLICRPHKPTNPLMWCGLSFPEWW